jgi:hypothetical protein
MNLEFVLIRVNLWIGLGKRINVVEPLRQIEHAGEHGANLKPITIGQGPSLRTTSRASPSFERLSPSGAGFSS